MKLVELKHPYNILRIIRAHSDELHFYYRKMYKLFEGCEETELIFSLIYELESDFYLN